MKAIQLFLTVSVMSLLGLSLYAQEVSPAKKEAVQKAVREYIKSDSSLKGAFLIKDPKSNGVRELKFDQLHAGVSQTKDGHYSACVDFRQGAEVLDLDFFLADDASGKPTVEKIVIHKVDGKPVSQ